MTPFVFNDALLENTGAVAQMVFRIYDAQDEVLREEFKVQYAYWQHTEGGFSPEESTVIALKNIGYLNGYHSNMDEMIARNEWWGTAHPALT
jgi:hypothetical protein